VPFGAVFVVALVVLPAFLGCDVEDVLTESPPLLLALWREQHPEGHEQTYFDFNVRIPPAQDVLLNFELAREE